MWPGPVGDWPSRGPPLGGRTGEPPNCLGEKLKTRGAGLGLGVGPLGDAIELRGAPEGEGLAWGLVLGEEERLEGLERGLPLGEADGLGRGEACGELPLGSGQLPLQ